jgi:uncharacterized protein
MTGGEIVPTAARVHRFDTTFGSHLFVADGSLVYDVGAEDAAAVDAMLAGAENGDDRRRAAALLSRLRGGSGQHGFVGSQPAAPPPLRSLSINVAQACNMSCAYCYADAGAFGGTARLMSDATARAAIDCLLRECEPEADLVIGFMGGEPLLNRTLVHDVTRYAADACARAKHPVRFSITTNGTLLTADDIALFASFPFTVTISIDGPAGVHRALRVLNNGADSYRTLLDRLELFQLHGRPRQLSGRATVTPLATDVERLLDALVALGFDDVGVAPVLVSPRPELAFGEEQFAAFLAQMVQCGTKALRNLRQGRRYPFSNFETALWQIHRGTHRPYPCGAGAAYLSAGADGELFACHRFIDDPEFRAGHVRTGLDQEWRRRHLQQQHVDRAEPCRECWARYLCGGGCYHEVSRRGRVSCEYIRGWLHFCLQSYIEVMETCPEYFHDRSPRQAE